VARRALARTAGVSRATLPRRFYDRDALDVAPELLNKLIVSTEAPERVVARLVEVEAYRGADDPGSHSYRGRTARNAVMFGRPGYLYVYFTYGMHWCANAVCGPGLQPHAVLLRAAVPIAGVDLIWARRPKARRDRDLCSGPAKLAQAFVLDRAHDGLDLTRSAIRIVDDGTPPPTQPGVSTRIGLAPGKGDEFPWRYYVTGDPNVSR
jgi:DNA-3-methyladenine glycosylase